jgi:hypothetical protein
VVNGRVEDPLNAQAWKRYDQHQIEFGYSSEVYGEAGYWWVRVKCDTIYDIREELGLKRELKFPLHLTIAKVKD